MSRMPVEVTIKPGDRKRRLLLEPRSTINDLLENLELLREEYVALLNDQVVWEGETLEEGDRVTLIRTCPGGVDHQR